MNEVTMMVPMSRRRALGILAAALALPLAPAMALEPTESVNNRLWKPIDPLRTSGYEIFNRMD
ncbi:hypothetical protein [Collimonas pratensis]|uniref:hypothetical protein n=1 Tax=Collimonas pratensis TaxID=279113 RepID=UPI0012E73FD6|nr:hypothetical protein [Collimonas pratensis]